ncbi:MAG: MFS transporter [Cytophagaceae bacterium]|jgi:MFS family permease|nr:MFS transporter [Cytophagaceae bacterium]
MKDESSTLKIVNATVIVAALGYFVDVYDLVLFMIIGEKSLLSIGFGGVEAKQIFYQLLDVQMVGMLIGGIVWGIIGDKRGRLSVLFGSIIMYSLANVANGLLDFFHSGADNTTITWYYILRFIAGFGLAGELGAGITLVSEIMKKEDRGIGTMIVASVGVTGAVMAGIIGKHLGWQWAYIIGGLLGLSLLLLRIGVFESGMFEKSKNTSVTHGNFFTLFKNKSIAIRYIYCITIGLPVWFIIGILINRAPDFALYLGSTAKIEREYNIMFCYAGLVFGDICSGALSQWLKSRKKVLYLFYLMSIATILVYLNISNGSATYFYSIIFTLGFSVGFWAIFVTVASEQFGTNIRATAATTVPNFVRGSLVLIGLLFGYCMQTTQSIIHAAAIVTCILFVLSFWAAYRLPETFGKELDYVE